MDPVKVVPGRKMHIPVHVGDTAIIEQQQAEAHEEGGVREMNKKNHVGIEDSN